MDLSMLNEKQYQGVTTSSQYTRIIAGAGSGKTKVLTNRIAYLLENGLAYPSGILGITFTNKAAAEIKERVNKICDNVANISLCTIHSWCAKFLRFESKYINYPSNFIILDEDDAHTVMKNIFVENGRPKNDSGIKKCLNWISNQKNKGLQYKDVKDTPILNSEMKDYMHFFEQYDKRLKDMNAFDFDDLLLKTIDILMDKNNGVQARYQKRITHILVDEFQDINDVQFHLISLLLSPTCELYVVGDPDQTIYTWRGANNRIIINLEKTLRSIYKDASIETIILNQNYRSTKKILDSANKLISHNQERVKKDLFSTQGEGDDISIFNANKTSDEASYIANTIKELHRDKINYKDIAILYRMNYLTRELESQLNLHNIPYKIYGGIKFYQRKEIKDILSFLNLLVNPNYDIGFLRIINVPKRNIGQASIDKLVESSNKNSQSLYDYVLENDDLPLTPSKNLALKDMVSILEHYKDLIKNKDDENVPDLLQNMIKELGYEKELDNDSNSKEERQENILEFFASMKQYYVTVENPSFQEFMENCILRSSQDEIENGDYVTLMTVHTAKGLEFDYVFIYSLCEGIFPSQRAILESKEGIEEERRLAYVAYTRAKKHLYLTYNQDYSFVMDSNLKVSRFIQEAGLKAKPRVESNFITKNEWIKSPNLTKSTINNYPNLKKTNGVTSWSVGDKIKHETFGLGTVQEVKDKKFIVVKFDDPKYGIKTLISNHFMITKLYN